MMDISRSIASLVATPKKKLLEVSLEGLTPEKILPETTLKVVEVPEHLSLLSKLFTAIEHVLSVLALRQRKPTLQVVRESVQSMTGRDLTDERLGQVWGAAADMLDLRWVGGELEVRQLAPDGEVKVPSIPEQASRREHFDALLADLGKREAPRRPLPARPATEASGVPVDAPSATPAVQRPSETGAQCQSTGDSRSRLQALRDRIRAKEQAAERRAAWRAQVSQAEAEMRASSGAIAAHGVVQHLFARTKGDGAAAAESEILLTLCSATSGTQNRYPMDVEAAQGALAALTAASAGWFTVEVGRFNGKTFFKRLPNGSPASALEQLQQAYDRLSCKKRALLEAGPGEETPTPAAPPASEEQATSGAAKPAADASPAPAPEEASAGDAPTSALEGGDEAEEEEAKPTAAQLALIKRANWVHPTELIEAPVQSAPSTASRAKRARASGCETAAAVPEQQDSRRPRRAAATRVLAAVAAQDTTASGRPRRAAAVACMAAIAAQEEASKRPKRSRECAPQQPAQPEAGRRLRRKTGKGPAAATEWM